MQLFYFEIVPIALAINYFGLQSACNFIPHFDHPNCWATSFCLFFFSCLSLSCSYWRLGKINHISFLVFILSHIWFNFTVFIYQDLLFFFCCKSSGVGRDSLLLIKMPLINLFISVFFLFRYSIVRPLVRCIRRHPNPLYLIHQHHQMQLCYPINPCLQSIIPLYTIIPITIPIIIPITIPTIIPQIISKAIYRRNQTSISHRPHFTHLINRIKIIIFHLLNNKFYRHTRMRCNRNSEVFSRLDSVPVDRVRRAVKAMLM